MQYGHDNRLKPTTGAAGLYGRFAQMAAYVAFAAGTIMAVLTLLGLWRVMMS